MRRFDMKSDWDARAREDARKAIACDEGRDDAVFRASGERDLHLVLDSVMGALDGRESALEIGCGTGRLLEPLAGHFGQVYGVDVSGEMVQRGRERLAHLGHVNFFEVDGEGCLPFKDETFDLCFSYITFHHIPAKPIVHRYIGEARRVLKERGIFRFQLFGRPEGILQTMRERLTNKSTWRGCKFTLPEITSMTQGAGFEIAATNYVNAESRPRLFGKTQPDVIWVTARKPGRAKL
ncbi:MAG TPA: class I SAM-dependent methyltransferase [Terriglobia bacterium]|jgi:SAM-dependent methyltransferase|nr:class I SAM-dependent methyltransferase [Terriglobia bacterium]